MQITQYQGNQIEWNQFVSSSRNGTFLFDRGYMDYHADRFNDASLVFKANEQIIGLLPANIVDGVCYTHGGLTFGGLVMSHKIGASEVFQLFHDLADYLQQQSIRKLVYKPVPHLYHKVPSEDDLYALYRLGAQTTRVDLSTTIDMSNRLSMAKGRKHSLSKARKAGVQVKLSQDYATFWKMLAENLEAQHQAKPTHSLAEIELLASRFNEIKLYMAYLGEEAIAGVLVYDYAQVVHTQYIALTDKAREVGGVDSIIAHLLDEVYTNKRYFNFGISTCKNGNYFNEGLAKQKEMFGGRSSTLQWLELTL